MSRNSAELGRAEYGEVWVDLVVEVTPIAGGGQNVQRKDFAILVDGKRSLAVNHLNEVYYVGDSVQEPVVFSVDDATSNFTLRFDVGWDPDSDPEREWANVDVTL